MFLYRERKLAEVGKEIAPVLEGKHRHHSGHFFDCLPSVHFPSSSYQHPACGLGEPALLMGTSCVFGEERMPLPVLIWSDWAWNSHRIFCNCCGIDVRRLSWKEVWLMASGTLQLLGKVKTLQRDHLGSVWWPWLGISKSEERKTIRRVLLLLWPWLSPAGVGQ